MGLESTPLTDDVRPPHIIPFCASCDMPVETFTVYPDADPVMFIAEATCHGKTQGVRMSRVEAEWRHRTNNHLVLFKRKEGFNLVR